MIPERTDNMDENMADMEAIYLDERKGAGK